MTSKQVLLHVESLCAGYGDSIIIEDIGFSLAAGSSLALLGRNGVGKSTLLRTLLGHARQRSGVIQFNARDISRATPYARVWQGLGWVPQERLMFPSLTVAEHLAIADRKGAWTIERNRELIAEHGAISVWIDVPFEVCWSRIEETMGTRPFARDRDSTSALFQTRLPLYEKTSVHVKLTGHEPASSIAETIAIRINEHTTSTNKSKLLK